VSIRSNDDDNLLQKKRNNNGNDIEPLGEVIKEKKEALKNNENNNENIQDIFDEEDQGKGIRNTLSLLEKRGLLGQTKYEGRYKDKNPEKEMKAFPKSSCDNKVNLEYRDAKGKLMTQKQAFRYSSWIFHNKMPSKRKLEKDDVKRTK